MDRWTGFASGLDQLIMDHGDAWIIFGPLLWTPSSAALELDLSNVVQVTELEFLPVNECGRLIDYV